MHISRLKVHRTKIAASFLMIMFWRKSCAPLKDNRWVNTLHLFIKSFYDNKLVILGVEVNVQLLSIFLHFYKPRLHILQISLNFCLFNTVKPSLTQLNQYPSKYLVFLCLKTLPQRVHFQHETVFLALFSQNFNFYPFCNGIIFFHPVFFISFIKLGTFGIVLHQNNQI